MGDRALNGPFVVATHRAVGPTVARLYCLSRNSSSAGLLVPMGPHVNDMPSGAVIRRVVSPTVGARTAGSLEHPEDPGMACGSMELMRDKPKNSQPLTI